jgi:hypothetical protein
VPHTKAAPRLREAIKLHLTQHNEELDDQAHKLLRRLASSVKAAKAFERLKLKNDDGKAAIIRACIEAENFARAFPAQEVKKTKKMLTKKELKRRRKQLRTAVATLRGFLNEIISEQQKPPDPLWIRPKAPEDIAAMGLGLAVFERWIEYVEKHVAELNLFRLRVSRKSEDPHKTLSAGQFAAIGQLADEVKRVTGRAHYEEIADLAGVILGAEVFTDQVRYVARRARGHWEWVPPKADIGSTSRHVRFVA